MTNTDTAAVRDHQAAAERLLANLRREVGGNSGTPLYAPDHQTRIIAEAQVHATLAQTAATLALAKATAATNPAPQAPDTTQAATAEPWSDDAKAALRHARGCITQYVATAEQWRYDRVVWAFAIMLGEIPADTLEPLSDSDREEDARRAARAAT